MSASIYVATGVINPIYILTERDLVHDAIADDWLDAFVDENVVIRELTDFIRGVVYGEVYIDGVLTALYEWIPAQWACGCDAGDSAPLLPAHRFGDPVFITINE